MLYSGFIGIVIVLALIAAYSGLKMIGRGTWLLPWLRGTLGLGLVIFALLLILIGVDMMTYRQLINDKPLGTISFQKKGDQHYLGTLTLIDTGVEKEYDIRGDQWQIDARIISWTGLLKMLGAKPGYRIDRLSGRYYSLEDEHRKKRTVHQLQNSEYWVDFWKIVRSSGNAVPLVDAVYGSATFLPMEEGAFFEISLTANGLKARPMNDVAEKAINRWK